MSKAHPVSQTIYVLVNRLALPVGAFIILIAIGGISDQLLGEYAIVMTFFFIMQTIPLLGLMPFVMREVARENSLAADYFISIGFIATLVSVLISQLVNELVLTLGYGEHVREAIRVVGYTIIPGILVFLSEIILTSLHRTRPIFFVAIVENTLRVVFSVGALWSGYGLVALIWVLFLTRVSVFCFYLVLMNNEMPGGIFRLPRFDLLRRAAKVVPAFLLATVLMLVINRLDFIVLSMYETSSSIGYYAIAYRLFDIAALALTATLVAAFPWAANKFTGSTARFVFATKNILIAYFSLLWVIVIIGFVLAETYVALLFPKQYPAPVYLTQLFILMIWIAGLDMAFTSILNAIDQQNKELKALSVGSILYTGLLFYLIPEVGVFGALVALGLSLVTQMVIKFYYLSRLLPGLFSAGAYYRIFFLGIASTLSVVYVYSNSEWMGGLVMMLVVFFVYPVGLLLLGVWKPLRLWRSLSRGKREYTDVDSLGALIYFVAEDHYHWRRHHFRMVISGRGGWENWGFLAVMLYRLSRYLELKKSRLLSRFVWVLNVFLTKADIRSLVEAGPGMVVLVSSGFVFSGKVGRNVLFCAHAGGGMLGKRDCGAGGGKPVIEEGVTLHQRSVILGGYLIYSGMDVPPQQLVRKSSEYRKLLGPSAASICT